MLLVGTPILSNAHGDQIYGGLGDIQQRRGSRETAQKEGQSSRIVI